MLLLVALFSGCLQEEEEIEAVIEEELGEEEIVIKENVSEEKEDVLIVYQRNGTIDTSLIIFYEDMPLVKYINMPTYLPNGEFLPESHDGTFYYSCETPDAWVKVVNGTIVSLHKELPKDL